MQSPQTEEREKKKPEIIIDCLRKLITFFSQIFYNYLYNDLFRIYE